MVSDDNQPIGGASVEARAQSTGASGIVAHQHSAPRATTDDHGFFRLAGATIQNRQRADVRASVVDVIAIGFEPSVLQIPPFAAYGEFNIGEIVLQRQRTVDVAVRDQHGAPVAGAMVFVRQTAPSLGSTSGELLDTRTPSQYTDEHGHCQTFASRRGVLMLATAPGFGTGSSICSPDSSTCTITIVSGRQIEITCLMPDRRPAVGARVNCKAGNNLVRLYANEIGAVTASQPNDAELNVFANWIAPDGAAYGGKTLIPAYPASSSAVELRLQRRAAVVTLRWSVDDRRIAPADSALLITSWSRSNRFLRRAIANVGDGHVRFSPGPPAWHRIRVYNATLGFGETAPLDTRQGEVEAIVNWREPGLHRPLGVRVAAPDGSAVADAGVRLVFTLPEWVWPPMDDDPFRLTIERRSDAAGMVVLPLAPVAQGRCTVLAPGYPPATLDVDPGQSEVLVRLKTGCELSFSAPELASVTSSRRSAAEHHLAILDGEGNLIHRAKLPESGSVHLAALPVSPVELRLEVDARRARRESNIVDASYLVAFETPPPVVRWSQRVLLQPDHVNEIVAHDLTPLQLFELEVAFEHGLPRGKLALTRLAVRGFASGQPRMISAPIADHRLRIGGLDDGRFVAEVLDGDGLPWWWAAFEVKPNGTVTELAVSVSDRFEIRLAERNWSRKGNIHRLSRDGHPLRWSKIPVTDTVRLSPGNYQVLSAGDGAGARFTVGQFGDVVTRR